jgi:uncharacterized membrane protein
MTQFEHLLKPALTRRGIRNITADDLTGALKSAVADISACPFLSLSFGAFYALIGAALVWTALGTSSELTVFPLLSAFFLIGPVSAVGLYEISRRRETGEPVTPAAIYGAVARNATQIAFFGALLLFLGFVWIKGAYYVYALFFGTRPMDLDQLLTAAFSTGHGIRFLIVGNLVGAAMAFLVYAISVIGVPMLLDRDVDAVTAALTSIEAVKTNPFTYAGFAALIVFFIGMGLATFMIGLVFTLPLVGHATWHLYRRAVVHPSE